MNRAQRILMHGWLGKALTVLTRGYFPFTTSAPIVNLTTAARNFDLTTGARDLALTTDGRSFDLTTDDRSMALTTERNFNLTYRRN